MGLKKRNCSVCMLVSWKEASGEPSILVHILLAHYNLTQKLKAPEKLQSHIKLQHLDSFDWQLLQLCFWFDVNTSSGFVGVVYDHCYVWAASIK